MPEMRHLIFAFSALALLLMSSAANAVPVDISADEISRTADGIVVAKGHVVIKREQETLRADEVHYRSQQQLLEARGHVVIESPKATIRAENALMHTNSKTGNMNNASITMPDGSRLTAKRIKRIDDQRFEAESITYSSCPIDDESWRIAAARAEIDQQEGTLTTQHGNFQFWGIPLIYTPWWQHPLKRRSGLLMPKVASGKRRGTEVALPLYLAPHESWDATMTPHWMSARGTMGEAELRHVSGAGYERLEGAMIYDTVINRLRYRYNGEIHWDLPAEIDFDATGDYVSDRDYLADYDTGNDISAYYLTSHAALSQGFDLGAFSGNWSVQARQQQNLLLLNNKTTLQILPRLESRMQWELSPNLLIHFDQQTTRFDRITGVDGTRLDLHPYIEIPWELKGGGLRANLQLGSHHTRYWLLQTNAANKRPIRSTGEVSVELRSDFERISDAKTWRHVVSPILRYDFIDAPDQNLLPNFDSGFGALTWSSLLSGNRYAGYDRIERSNRFSAVIESRLQHKAGMEQAARDILTLRGGIAYDLHRQSVDPALQAAATRPFSNLLAEISWSPTASLYISSSGQYNSADRYWATGYASAAYYHSSGNSMVLSYSYTDARYTTETQLISATAKLRVAERWHLAGTWQYDTLLKTSQHSSVSLKYSHPCWSLGTEGYRTNRRTGTTNTANFGFRILLEFKGLGSVGSN